MKVKLEHIIEGMELQSEEIHAYVNLETGEVVNVSREALLIAEDGEEYEHLPDWQQDEAKLAYDIVDNFDQYATLPSSYDIDEYEIMENFCYSLADEQQKNTLLNCIRGKGAFRRFKDHVYRLGIADEWYDYRDQSYKEIAIEFCERNDLEYIDASAR